MITAVFLVPAGATVDLKKTSYKKLGKLLSVFEKKGLLGQKLVHKQEHLATVNREHALYTAFAASHGGAGPQVTLLSLYISCFLLTKICCSVCRLFITLSLFRC